MARLVAESAMNFIVRCRFSQICALFGIRVVAVSFALSRQSGWTIRGASPGVVWLPSVAIPRRPLGKDPFSSLTFLIFAFAFAFSFHVFAFSFSLVLILGPC